MNELMSTPDVLVAEELHGLTDGDVPDRVAELVAVQSRIAAELTRTVRRADTTQAAERDGLKSMRSWLVGHARAVPGGGVADPAVGAGALEHFPALAAGFVDGDVTAARFDVVAGAVGERERAYSSSNAGPSPGATPRSKAASSSSATSPTLNLTQPGLDRFTSRSTGLPRETVSITGSAGASGTDLPRSARRPLDHPHLPEEEQFHHQPHRADRYPYGRTYVDRSRRSSAPIRRWTP